MTELRIETLSPNYMSDIIRFRENIVSNLLEKDYIYPEPDEEAFVQSCFAPGGLTLGAFFGSHLVAYAALKFPSQQAGSLASLVTEEALCVRETAEFAAGMVQSEYRGRGLHSLLLGERVKESAKRGKRTLLSIASPKNTASISNMHRLGFVSAKRVQLLDPNYGILTRVLLRKDL